MNYEQCLKYLETVQSLGIKFGLENVRTVLAAFGGPHKKLTSVLVAGTNGKGSVCAMLTRILSLHGFKTGLFTSPHLVKPEERIRIGDRLIPTRTFSRIVSVLKEGIEELIASKELLSPPTYFEFLTCMALLFFEEQKVDMAVLEVGMGGRFDATNVVEPGLSVITTISGEHQKYLGESLSQIAFEKAGIVRTGIPVVCGVEKGEAYDTIKTRAEELKAPFIGVFNNKDCFSFQKSEQRYSFRYQKDGESYVFSPSLQGKHQGKNAAVAIAACRQLSRVGKSLDKKKIVEGIETTRWAGRLELFSRSPLVFLDGAHNVEGAQVLKEFIEDFLPSPPVLVFAVMRDKEITKIADILFPLAKEVILTQFPFFKGASPDEVESKIPRFRSRIIKEPDSSKAMSLAVRSAGPDGCVLAAGSLFLIGEIKKEWGAWGRSPK
jgi:dihydrofolate synthase/folylpolyglutamate synthase